MSDAPLSPELLIARLEERVGSLSERIDIVEHLARQDERIAALDRLLHDKIAMRDTQIVTAMTAIEAQRSRMVTAVGWVIAAVSIIVSLLVLRGAE